MLPLLIGALLIGVEYFTGFIVTDSQIQLVEFMIGSTVIGGTANAGFKRYIKFRENQT